MKHFVAKIIKKNDLKVSNLKTIEYSISCTKSTLWFADLLILIFNDFDLVMLSRFSPVDMQCTKMIQNNFTVYSQRGCSCFFIDDIY